MLKLTFKQTPAELMVRAASTIIFNTLNQLDYPSVALYELAENPQYGFTASASIEEVGAKFVRITDLKDGGINWDTVPYCKCDEPEKYLIYPNDILFARTGATTGKTHLVKEAPYAVFASYLIRIRPKPLVEPEYLYSFFQSDAYWTQILDEKEGSAQPNVNGQKLINILVPMVDSKIQSAISKFLAVVRKRQDGSFEELPELPPPLEEQRRIVVLVEELVGKVEEVRSLRQQLLDTRLPYLREALFYQVFQGKILPHHQDVEPASKLLGKINALKERLIVEKKIPNKNKIPPILPSEKPYEIPSSWEWVRLDDICLLITDGTHQTPRYVEKGMMFLSAQNIKPYRFIPQNHKCVSYEDYLSYIANKKAEKGDILLTRVGAGIGEAAMVNQDLDFAFYVSIGLLKPVQDYVYSPYIVHWLNSPDGVASSRKNTLGKGHSQGNLNLNLIRKFVLPLPPLPEQRRIVTYLDELQTKVDTMKRLREEAMKELNALLPSILDKAFKGEL